jgi:hypothetical protein
MATSGTVARTVLDTGVLLEHAMRRCGIPASMQTPESVEIGKQNLYLLLLNLANRGINLWCVEKDLIGVATGKANYTLPDGTIRLLNVLYSSSTRVSGTDTVAADSVTTELTFATKVVRYGFKPTSSVAATITLDYSDDGASWTTAQTLDSQTWVGGSWYWFDLDPAPTATYWRITSSAAFSLTEFYLASAISDLPMTQFNRDEYAQQTNKTFQQRPCTNYYFDKTLTPSITLWPLPNNNYDQLSVWRHRFVQDVGTLTQQIEVPQQWMEAIIWQLSARLVYEIPGVDSERRREVIQAAQAFMLEAELGETDNAPIFIYSGVGVYTR